MWRTTLGAKPKPKAASPTRESAKNSAAVSRSRPDEEPDEAVISWASVLLQQGKKIPFPYLKGIYWVRVQGKSLCVTKWWTVFCRWWISSSPRIRNLILEGNEGISAGLPWRGQTGCGRFFFVFFSLYWGLLMDTEYVNKRLVHFAHPNSETWRAHNQFLWTGQDAHAVSLPHFLSPCLSKPQFATVFLLADLPRFLDSAHILSRVCKEKCTCSGWSPGRGCGH